MVRILIREELELFTGEAPLFQPSLEELLGLWLPQPLHEVEEEEDELVQLHSVREEQRRRLIVV